MGTERLLGPESLTAQKVELETSENLERIYQAIANSPEFTPSQKESIFKTIVGKNHVPDPA
jgi:hypothetical protein